LSKHRPRVPNLCADFTAWVSSGFQTLPSSTMRFDGRFFPVNVAIGYVPALLLATYGRPLEKVMLNRTNQLEMQLTDCEARAAESWVRSWKRSL